MATQAQQSQLLAFLVGAFDAAPTAEIFAELTAAIDAGVSVDGLSDIIVGSDVFKGLYADDAAFVANFPTALVGDFVSAEVLADAEGVVAQWINEDGMSIAAVISNALIALAGVDSADETWGAAKVALENKVTVAQYYVDNVSGATLDLATLQGVLAGVTQDAATVTTAQASIDATANAGETFTLTTGAEEVTGTAMNDTFVAVSSALSSARTLDTADKIDGGEGTDTLQVTLDSTFSGFASTGGVSNVEVVELTNNGSVARTFTGTGVSGVEEYKLTGAVNLAGQTEIATVTAGARTADLSVAYASKVTDGTADEVTLNVTDFGTADDASTTANEEKAVAVTLAGVETVNVAASGTNVINADAVSAKAVTASGEGALKVTSFNAATKTVDASGVSGSVDLVLGTNVSAVTSVATGSGNDTVTVADIAADLTANATVVGGEGEDKLSLAGAGTIQYTQSGFETLSLGNMGAGATISMKNTTDVTTIEAVDAFAGGATIATLGTADLAVNLQGTSASTLTLDNTGSTTINVEKPASTATTASPTTNTTSVTATGTNSVSLNVAEKMSYTGVVTAAKATSVEASIAGQTTGAAAIVAAAATSVAITSVANDSTLKIDAAKATDLNISNAKKLTVAAASDLSGVESFTAAGAGDLDLDTNNIALSSLNSASITNTGAVALDNVGSATLDYSTTVTSTGSKSFAIGTMTTDDHNITLSVTDSLGTVGAGAIDAGTGNVDVTVSTASTSSLAAVTGKDVTLDFSGALDTVTFGGAITATGNVTVLGSELKGNDLSNDIVLNGTAQTVSLTGGLGTDTIDVTASATSTKITITGDLGADTGDDIAVTGNAATTSIDISGLTAYDASVITGGALGETIKGGAGADSIDAGAGADTLTGGAGQDTFVQDAADSVVLTAETVTEAAIAVGETITFGNGLDTITDFTAGTGGDILDAQAAGLPTAALASDQTGDTSGTMYYLSGTYDSTTGVFTITANGATGSSTLIFEGDAGADLSAVNDAVLLVGVDSDDLVAANII